MQVDYFKRCIKAGPMDDAPVHIPIDGVIDLHTFSPKDASSVVDEYLYVCGRRGIREIKIIHGKGKGVLRRTVESVLKKHPLVFSYKQDSGPSSWGATVVFLKGPENSRQNITS